MTFKRSVASLNKRIQKKKYNILLVQSLKDQKIEIHLNKVFIHKNNQSKN